MLENETSPTTQTIESLVEDNDFDNIEIPEAIEEVNDFDNIEIPEATEAIAFSNAKFPMISWMGIQAPVKRKRPRGRPKKHQLPVDGVTVHRCEIGPVFKTLSRLEKMSIEKEFQSLQTTNTSIREAIQSLANSWGISYRQVQEIAAKFI